MPVPGIDPCRRCGKPGHWADDTDPLTGHPKCPYRYPAKTLAEHERRRQDIIDRFAENRISTEYKRTLIEQEHQLWRNRPQKRKAS